MSDTAQTSPDDQTLAAEYALGLLEADEARAFEERMGREPALRAAYAAWAEDFARMTESFPEVVPPAAVKRALMARLFGPVRRRIWMPFLGGLVAAGLALWVVWPETMAVPTYQAEIAAQDGSLRIAASYTEDGRLSLSREAGQAAPGRVLELWLIAEGGAPVSLGVLPEATTAEVSVPDALRGALAGALLAISDEPPGGSPTGAPTGAVLAVGPILGS